jgi:hypothetical protein
VNLAAPRYLQFPSTHAAYAYVQAQELITREEERESETRRLCEAFARVDLIIEDSLSVTGCTQAGRKLRAWA